MAVYTCGAYPHVVVYATVLVIHLRLPVLMAMRTRCNVEIRRYQMAIGTQKLLVGTVVNREGVIKEGTSPHVGIVAHLARRRESLGNVIGIVRHVEIVDMTCCAARGNASMIEHRAEPGICAMASFAIGGETFRNMVRIGRHVEFIGMTSCTARGNASVIKYRAEPSVCAMTRFTISGETIRDMVWIGRHIKIVDMASRAARRDTGVIEHRT